MTETSSSQKQPSLMRRVSQKAADKLRRRTSSSSHDHGERSGPVVMRHRSGSASGSLGEGCRLGIQHHDDDDDDDSVIVIDQLDGSHGSNGGQKHSATLPHERVQPDTNVGIFVPDDLQSGTAMTRVTRKKRTKRIFTLDINTARVSWDPTKPTSRFYVDDMKEIRTGANARNYREELNISQDSEDRWMTIIFVDPQDNGKLKTLHVIAPSIELFTLWTSTLEAIHRYRTEMMAGLAMQGEKFVDAHWRNYMDNRHVSNSKDERLSFDDVDRLCRRLHVNCSRRLLKEKFKRADRDNSGYLNFQEFQRFVKLLKEREEIKEIWEERVVNPHHGMTKSEFKLFLRDVQKINVDADSVQVDKVFRKFCRQSTKMQQHIVGPPAVNLPAGTDAQEPVLTREGFAAFLLSSSYNPPLLGTTAGQILDHPLNEYYCSSSHNTYLMGRQVRGESSVEGYIRVLQRGCRCVEIDCWDGVDGRPVVTHGHTGTSECLFSDVISAIAKYAFLASPYPLILSLEVHCSLEQQVKMADILRDILGDKLLTEPLKSDHPHLPHSLPSPQALKHRILIKVKGSDRRDPVGEHILDKKNGITTLRKTGIVRSSASCSSVTSESEDPSSGSGDRNKAAKVSTKIAYGLGSLGVYYRGQKFRNFALPGERKPPLVIFWELLILQFFLESKTYNHVFSFQEKSFVKFCKDPIKKGQLEKHNVRYFLRVYPSGFRVNSSNPDPLEFWRRGVQMVALNWQTYDLGVQLNEAMFGSGSDRSGYVLKPKALRGATAMFGLENHKIMKLKKQVQFSIKVISAQQLPRAKEQKMDESINPFVEVEVFSSDDKTKGTSTSEGGIDVGGSKGVSGLGAPQKRRTKVVYDDGFHPLFREKMRFSLITKFEDLVFVRFSVYNNSEGGDVKSLIATFTAKLSTMQQGMPTEFFFF
jgi:phosphatidylinositol phospholipase C delta